MLAISEFNDLVHKSTWTTDEENKINEYLDFIRNALDYNEYMQDNTKKIVDDFTQLYNTLQERANRGDSLNENEKKILMIAEKMLANAQSKKDMKENARNVEYVRVLKRDDAYGNHGGISAGLTILFIVFNLGIFIASIILMLN